MAALSASCGSSIDKHRMAGIRARNYASASSIETANTVMHRCAGRSDLLRRGCHLRKEEHERPHQREETNCNHKAPSVTSVPVQRMQSMGRMPVCAYQTRLCRRRSMRERPRMQGEESTQHALHGNKATHHRPFWQSECMKHARPFGSTAVLALTLRIDRREAPANTPTCLDDRNWHVTAAPRVAAPRETGGVALSRTPSCALGVQTLRAASTRAGNGPPTQLTLATCAEASGESARGTTIFFLRFVLLMREG